MDSPALRQLFLGVFLNAVTCIRAPCFGVHLFIEICFPPPSFPLSPADFRYMGYNQGLGFCGDHCACALNDTDTAHRTDDGLAARAIELMSSHKANSVTPWFVGVGFIRPHVDWSGEKTSTLFLPVTSRAFGIRSHCMRCALLSARGSVVLIGACNPMSVACSRHQVGAT